MNLDYYKRNKMKIYDSMIAFIVGIIFIVKKDKTADWLIMWTGIFMLLRFLTHTIRMITIVITGIDWHEDKDEHD